MIELIFSSAVILNQRYWTS